MLRQRIATAVALLAVLLPCLMADSRWPFALFSLTLAVAGTWEWARLSGVQGLRALLAAMPVLLFGMAMTWKGTTWDGGVWLALGLGWFVLLVHSLRLGPAAWSQLTLAARLALGWLVMSTTWAALVQAHAMGVGFLLSVMATVWVSDIAAYFCGRQWGRRRLAARISPGKSWEGVWGAALGVAIYVTVLMALEVEGRVPGLTPMAPSVFLGAGMHFGPEGSGLSVAGLLVAIGAGWGLAALGIAGDLFESLQKRAVGVKDSSRLLPGHGGVLDRVDALLPMLPWAMAIAVWSR